MKWAAVGVGFCLCVITACGGDDRGPFVGLWQLKSGSRDSMVSSDITGLIDLELGADSFLDATAAFYTMQGDNMEEDDLFGQGEGCPPVELSVNGHTATATGAQCTIPGKPLSGGYQLPVVVTYDGFTIELDEPGTGIAISGGILYGDGTGPADTITMTASKLAGVGSD